MPLGSTLADWAWVPSYERLRVWLSGEPEPRDLSRIEDRSFVFDVTGAAGRPWLASIAFNVDQDSAFLDVTVLPEGRATRWATFKAGSKVPLVSWLADGSLVLWNQETETTATLYRVRGPGRVERLGTIPRPLESFSTSLDGRRVVLVTNEFRGDVWLAHVARGSEGH